MRWIWRPPHRPFGLENRDDPIHAERRQDALRLHTFIVAGPACRAAHSDLHGQAGTRSRTRTPASPCGRCSIRRDRSPTRTSRICTHRRPGRRGGQTLYLQPGRIRGFHRGARSGACDLGVADCATAHPGVFGEPPAHVRERASARPAPIRRPRIKAGPEVLCSRPFRRPLPGKADRVNVRA
jgi:hypothetical protein